MPPLPLKTLGRTPDNRRAGPNGVNSRANVLLRYTTTFKKKWTVAASFEFPKSSIAADGEYTKAAVTMSPTSLLLLNFNGMGAKAISGFPV